jgi:uncharacterized protein (DUF952 family)
MKKNILICMEKNLWSERKNKKLWGKRNLKTDGFIHSTAIRFFDQVAPYFKEIKDELVILCIDENKLKSEIRYEREDMEVKAYPHIYGLVNNDAVISVVPFLRDDNGDYIHNPEFDYM